MKIVNNNNIYIKHICSKDENAKRSFIKRPFTFLELMIVVVVVSVMVAVAAPKFSNFYESLKLNSNARQLKMFFEYAKNTALTKRTDCVVFYVAKKREFLLKLKYKKSKLDDNEFTPDIMPTDGFNEPLINENGVFRRVKLINGVTLINAQAIGALPIPKDTDFNFDITPYGVDTAYKFTIGNEKNDQINIVIMAGSGITKIFKPGSSNYYGD